MNHSEKYEHIRLEYVNGTATLKDLADKHGVSYKAIFRRSAREKWVAAREEVSIRVQSQIIGNAIKKRIKEAEDWNDTDLQVAKALRAVVINALATADKVRLMDPMTARVLAGISEAAQRLAYTSLGIDKNDSQAAHPGQSPPGQELAIPTLQDFYAGMKFIVNDPDRYELIRTRLESNNRG